MPEMLLRSNVGVKVGVLRDRTVLLSPRSLGGVPHCSPMECLTRGIKEAGASGTSVRKGRGVRGRLGVTRGRLAEAQERYLELPDRSDRSNKSCETLIRSILC